MRSTQDFGSDRLQQGTPEAGKNKDERVKRPSMLGVAMKHWRVLLVVTFFSSCLSFVRSGRQLFFALEGHSQNLGQDEIGRITSLSFAIDGLLFPVAGKMLDGLGRRPTGAISAFGLGLAFLALVGGKHGQGLALPSFILYAVLGGLANGLSAGIVQVMAADLAPPSVRSEFIAVFRMLTRSADVIAPMLIGVLAEVGTLEASEIVAAAVSFAATIWALLFVKETLKKNSAAPDTAKMLPDQIGKQEDIEKALDLAVVNGFEEPPLPVLEEADESPVSPEKQTSRAPLEKQAPACLSMSCMMLTNKNPGGVGM